MDLKGYKILLTGPAGNLGGTLAKALAPDNDLWGLDRFPVEGQEDYWRAQGLTTVAADFTADDLQGILPEDFDYVIHVAANTDPIDAEAGMRDNAEGSGLLMKHCRNAKAFLHVSTVGVYAKKTEANPIYRETDTLGGESMGNYTSTKLAAEGAVRAMCRVLNLPTVICRMAVQYGDSGGAGMMGILIPMLLEGRPIPIRSDWPQLASLISNDDIVRFLGPCLGAATVPATIVHWAGDENVSIVDIVKHLASLAGVEPQFVSSDTEGFPCFPVDPTRRQSITGLGQVEWREGLTRLYNARIDGIRASLNL